MEEDNVLNGAAAVVNGGAAPIVPQDAQAADNAVAQAADVNALQAELAAQAAVLADARQELADMQQFMNELDDNDEAIDAAGIAAAAIGPQAGQGAPVAQAAAPQPPPPPYRNVARGLQPPEIPDLPLFLIHILKAAGDPTFTRRPTVFPLICWALATMAAIDIKSLVMTDFLITSVMMLSCNADGSPALLSTTNLETYTYLARKCQAIAPELPRDVPIVSAALLSLVVSSTLLLCEVGFPFDSFVIAEYCRCCTQG